MNITIEDAKKIAQTYIQEPRARAETPELKKIAKTLTYVVPVIFKGEMAGIIYIDPHSGKNIGGVGGAPIG